MSKIAKDAIVDLIACKARSICERDKLVNVYIAKRIDVYERRMQTINEYYRANIGLPICPPMCITQFEEIDNV